MDTKRFKPSGLPIGTVIKTTHSEYIKRKSFKDGLAPYWTALPDHNHAFVARISDAGLTEQDQWDRNIDDITAEEPSDDYFDEFEVVSFPASMTEMLIHIAHQWLAEGISGDMTHLLPTHEDLLVAAITNTNKQQAEGK